MTKNTLTKSLFDTANSKAEVDYRLQLLKYLDTAYYENGEYLFFNMLEYTRFIKAVKDIAYTNRERLIFLNAPTPLLGNENYKWDFVFAHECLHQIYDTFGVGDMIKKELGNDRYDHYLLNVASDCVINETLSRRYKKKSPDKLITAKYLKQKYNISYNINEDTQYSMYLKLLEAKDKHEEMRQDEVLSKNTSIHDKAQPGEGQPGQPGEGEGQPSNQPGEGEGQQGQGKQAGEAGDKPQKSFSNEEFGEYKDLIDYYDSEPEVALSDLIDKAKNTLTGPIGEFIDNLNKIPAQIKKTKYGINLSVAKGQKTDYIKELFNKSRAILSNKIQSIQKKYKNTYTRVNRRNPFNDGGIIKKGRKIEQDKIDLDISYYVDISGSMTDVNVSKIFNNLYSNSKSVADTYTKTYKDILDNVLFNYYAFNEHISPVKNNVIPKSIGSNVDLDVILKYIKKTTETSLINIIITDAGFDIFNDKIIAEWKDVDGFLIIITNTVSGWPGYAQIEQQSKGKITAIHTPAF